MSTIVPKCLIIDPMHASIIPLAESIGLVPHYQPDITRQQVLEILPEYYGLFVRSKTTIDVEVLHRATNLKFIARAGAGMDQIDIEQAKLQGITLFNASEGNANALGEHALALLLAVMNKVCTGNQEVRNKLWRREENRGYEVSGSTVGLIGYGFMGKSFAKKLSGFDCEVIAYDKYKTGHGDNFAQEAALEELFERCDIVSFHIPLNQDNKNLADYNYLDSFKKPYWLLNTARGEVLDTSAAVALLKSGKILGAGLDVLENEKLNTLTALQMQNFNFLCNAPNVVLTPHVGGWTYESYKKINEVLVKKIKDSNIVYAF